MSKPIIAFYDIYATDHGYFEETLGKDYELTFTPRNLNPETADLAAKAEIICIRNASRATAEVMAKMPHLKHIALRITGFDNVDLDYARTHGISISNVPSYGEATVAEYAIMLLLAVSRRLMLAAHSVHAGVIKPAKLMGHDLHGKTLGIIGAGRIGRHAAKIGRGFGMNVIAYDPYPNESAAADIGYQYVPLDELLERSDCISLHAPATPENHHLLGAKQFAKMKTGVFIVNTGRGAVIDTLALIEALESKKVGGAGLDVLEGEEYIQVAPELHLLEEKRIDEQARQALSLDILQKMPNVLITSHNAFNSIEALSRIRETTAANIQAFRAGQSQNRVGHE